VPELQQQQYVVDDLENATDDEWQSAKRRREKCAGTIWGERRKSKRSPLAAPDLSAPLDDSR
jgi:hypothetical protein